MKSSPRYRHLAHRLPKWPECVHRSPSRCRPLGSPPYEAATPPHLYPRLAEWCPLTRREADRPGAARYTLPAHRDHAAFLHMDFLSSTDPRSGSSCLGHRMRTCFGPKPPVKKEKKVVNLIAYIPTKNITDSKLINFVKNYRNRKNFVGVEKGSVLAWWARIRSLLTDHLA